MMRSAQDTVEQKRHQGGTRGHLLLWVGYIPSISIHPPIHIHSFIHLSIHLSFLPSTHPTSTFIHPSTHSSTYIELSDIVSLKENNLFSIHFNISCSLKEVYIYIICILPQFFKTKFKKQCEP